MISVPKLRKSHKSVKKAPLYYYINTPQIKNELITYLAFVIYVMNINL